jgi:CDP-glucose 4,6-dehydratase
LEQAFWQDRSVLVTGATGHIGGWLVKCLLKNKTDVVCLVRDWVPQCDLVRTGLIKQVKIVQGDLRDIELLRRTLGEYEISTVFHLAAQSIVGTANRDPEATFDTNIRGTWSLLEACRTSPLTKQIVVASTDKVYGENEHLPYVEDMPLLAIYPHDVSKACAEMIVQSYVRTYGLHVAVTRLPNIYGGGDLNWTRIIPGTIRSIIKNEQPVINSNGKFIRDYLYVEDAVDAHLLLAEKLANNPELHSQAFNISSETYLTVIELVEHILKLMDSSLQSSVRDQSKNEISNQYLSAAKARQILGWQPAYTMEEGLRRTIEWYKTFFSKLS